MKVTTEITDTKVVTLSIEPDADRMAQAKRRAASALSKYRPVPGYRPGKAPLAIVERIFGAETVLREAVNEAAEDIFRHAVEQADVRPLDPGEFEIASTDPLLLKIKVSLIPTVELADYRALHVEPEADPVVAPSAVDEELEEMRDKAATYEPVDRPLMATDQAVLEFTATEEGAEKPLVQEEAFEVVVSPQEEPYPLVDKLLALRVGESAKVDAEYDAEHKNKTLAGKFVHIQFTVKGVREKTLPELNDEFAKDVSDHETLAALRESITTRMQAELDKARRDRETDAAIKALVDGSKIEYPAAAVDRELEAMIQSERSRVQSYGFEWANYLRIIRRTEEEMRSEMRPRAEQRLVRSLALGEFAMAEGLDVDPNEIIAELDRAASQYGERAEEAKKALVKSGALSTIGNDLLSHKAVEHLVAVLTGRAEAHPKAAPEAEPPTPEAAETNAAAAGSPAAESPAAESPADEPSA